MKPLKVHIQALLDLKQKNLLAIWDLISININFLRELLVVQEQHLLVM